MGRALQAPLLSAAVLLANLRALRRRPGLYLRLLGRLLAASAANPGFLLRTLALFPKSVWVAERLEAEETAHLHAHFATHPATMALIVSSLTGIPWSVTVHAHDIFVSQAMLREKLAAARFIRSISGFNRELLERRFPGEAADKVRVIHVGIDPEVYRGLPDPAADSPTPQIILCVASHRPYKGLPMLLEACRRLRSEGVAFHCEIVGDGPLRPELERRITELGLAGTVSLLGALPQHEVTRRLGESAVFVLPSIVAPDGQMEGIPVALMEAMAAGRPVVASALSGIPELVEDGVSGFLVQPGDAPAIAAAVERLLADPALGLRMGERGREKVDREFRLDGTIADLVALIDQHAEPADPEVVDLLRRSGLDGAGVRRVHRRTDSMVVEALASGAQDLILKVQRSRPGESRPPLERARHEFEVLSCLHQRFAGVPRPLRLVEEAAAVVMERCRGTALDEIVRRGRMARGAEWDDLLAALRRAGGWLRLFQRHTCRSSRVGHHGDFWPGNVYVDRDEGVQVIDFEGYREGLPWEDPAYFLIHLELFFAWPGLRGRFEKASAAFLDGYLEGGRLDRSALNLCLTTKARQVLDTTGERRQRRALVSILRRAGAER
jgi:colanic acid/amylovoran biosynthesis glycosyltransferase